jgi:hypothetical protein
MVLRSGRLRAKRTRAILGGTLAVCAGSGACAGIVLGDEYVYVSDGGTPDSSLEAGVPENENNRCTIDDQRVVWALQFGDASSQQVGSTATDGDRLYVAGSFRGALDFGKGALISKGGLDYFLACFDSTGHPNWSTRFGDVSDQYDGITRLQMAPDGGVLFFGNYRGTIDFGDGIPRTAVSSDGFVTRYDATGKHVWTRVLPSDGQDSITAVAVDPSPGEIVVSARVQGATTDFAGAPIPAPTAASTLLAKLDPSGNQIWAKLIGGTNYEVAQAIAIYPNGDIVVTGNIDSPTDFGGGVEPFHSAQDAFVVVYKSNGDFVRAKVYGGPGTQSIQRVALDGPTGDMIFAGHLAGSVGFDGPPISTPWGGFAARLTASGAHIESRAWNEFGLPRSLLVDTHGDIVISGPFSTQTNVGAEPISSVGTQDGLIWKVGPTLGNLSTLQIGSIADDNAWGVAADPAGNLFVGAHFQDKIDIEGCGELTSAGDADVLLMKLRY